MRSQKRTGFFAPLASIHQPVRRSASDSPFDCPRESTAPDGTCACFRSETLAWYRNTLWFRQMCPTATANLGRYFALIRAEAQRISRDRDQDRLRLPGGAQPAGRVQTCRYLLALGQGKARFLRRRKLQRFS